MAGNADNIGLWSGIARAWVNYDLDAALPSDVDTPFGGTWDEVGLLDGDAGFVDQFNETKTPIKAWGLGTQRTAFTDQEKAIKFVALERNAVTDALQNPGSTATSIIVPTHVKLLVAFELRDGVKVIRHITGNYAEVSRDGDVTITEKDAEKLPFVATIYADPTTAEYFVRQATDDVELADGGS